MQILPNFHIIEVTYLGPTNNLGSRVKLTSHRFKHSIIISYDYECGWTDSTAQKWLISNGFELIGKAESKNGYFFISSTFKGLK